MGNDNRGSALSQFMFAVKENFELALETDNSNTHVRFWLSKLHLKYHVPGACKAVGAALLVEAADMGDADAQYELAYRLRVEGHVGAAIAYGSLLVRGVQVPECLTKISAKKDSSTKTSRKIAETHNPLEMAREQFEIAAKAKCDLGFRWLKRLEEEEKRLTNL
ncbi:uncharacterized protein LOC141720895 isoform X2 [Apium graveolens]|uniref:uncharacterized protein LOC141720895 isoform X2 n=1 Tax=Apium graveolens TaxID=4045 RepID=UPI003D7BD581